MRHILKFEAVLIVVLVILNSLQSDLSILRGCCSALGRQGSDGLSFVDLCDALDGESPKYFFTDHHQYLALVHPACIWNEGERNFEGWEGLDVEFKLRSVEESENLLILFAIVEHFNSHSDIILEWVSELDRVRMLLHQSIKDSVVWERNRRKTHSTELILPISYFFWREPDAGTLNIIQTGRNVLNLDFPGLKRAEFEDIGLQGKLLRISVNHSYHSFVISRVLQLNFDTSRHS